MLGKDMLGKDMLGKDWLAQNHHNVSEWRTCLPANIIKIQQNMLGKDKADIIIPSKCNLSMTM
jgi:hypothetical protein